MSLINRIFGLGKPILTSNVIFKDSGDIVTTIKASNDSIGHTDYISLVLFHYAKMLLIIPKNYYGIIPFIETMEKATNSSEFHKSMVLDFTDIEMDFSLSNPKLKRKDRIYTTRLFKYSDTEWHVKTGIPILGPTSQALLSIKELILEMIGLFTEQEIKILKDALNKMSTGYLNGVDYRSGKNSHDIPTKSLLSSIGQNLEQ
jgi:hypothetical protein